MSLDFDTDDQDQAETFDEDNITPDGFDIATSDMQPDVLDVTSAAGDEDDFEAEDDDDFDPDKADEGEVEMLLEEDDGVDASRRLPRDDGDLVMDSDESPADFEGDDGAIDDVVDDFADEDEATDAADRRDPKQPSERALDEGVEETFPASDPVSVSPGAD